MYLPVSRPVTALATLAWLFAAGQPAWAQERPRPSALAAKVAEAPSLDGNVLEDPIWRGVAPITDFWQSAPDAGEPASERTEVRIVYTADAIYFGIVCYDANLGGLTVADSRRDSPLDDSDSFRILLDTHHDGQNGFVFGTNPAALEYDGQVSNEGASGLGGPGGGGDRQQGGSGGGFNLNWDGSWQVRTTASGDGWSAEFAIPFRTLRYSAGSSQEWGLNLQRTIRRRKETAYWSPLPIQFDLLRVSMAGTLSGLDVPPQRNLKVIPYALGEARQRRDRPSGTTMLGDLGADLKYSLTPSLTLDASYNTDFAQVEVDEQQINLDRFNLFFPEKRPFFLENAGLFAVGSPGEAEVFFSRRIGIADNEEAIPIVGGGRLSGRVGPMNIGLLNMQTEASGLVPANNFTVARVRRDLPNRSNIGAIFVGRQATGRLAGPDDRNQAFAADGRLGIGATGLLTGFAARTSTPGIVDGQHAYQLQARNETQPLSLGLTYTETGRNFNPEVGFLSRRNGFRKLEAQAFSRIRPSGLPRFQEIRPHTSFRSFWNHDGFQETLYWHLDSHWELKNGHEFHTGMNVTREGVIRPFEIYPGVFVAPGTYHHQEAQLVLQTNQGASLSARSQLTAGGLFGGDRVALQQTLRWRIGETFSTDVSWTVNNIDLPVGSFVTNLARTRISYSFSPRVFVQSLVQYNDRDELWSTNFRFGWLQQANTGIFVVYNDSHAFDDLGLGLRPDRSFIVKISRMFDALN
jgi:hypothetical protein